MKMINQKINKSAFSVYEPREDSYLLEKQVRRKAFGRVLDLGTGSGIQALAALTNHEVGEVIAADIDEQAVSALREKIKQLKLRKIKVIQSNLFDDVEGKYNTIIFNPPYLPQDKNIEDQTIYGGKKGWEISERFLNNAVKYLSSDGKILFLFSSLTNKEKINEIIKNNLLQFEELDQQKLAFEELYVYEITKSEILKMLAAKGVEEIHYFTKGQRGEIYSGLWDKNKWIKSHFTGVNQVKVAIKIKKAGSKADTMKNEVQWLKIINQRGIGPKLFFYGEEFIVLEFAEGLFIQDWIEAKGKAEITRMLMTVLDQCYILDSLGVNKEEMHHPLKHIIVTAEDHPVLLDFERTAKTEKPKNVTQFIEFICRIKSDLESKGLLIDVPKLRNLAGEYKDTLDKEVIKEVKGLF